MLFKPYALRDSVTRTVEGDMIRFSGYSVGGRPFCISTKLSDANEWLNGGLIQNCFPYLDADDREILKTGIDAQEWETMFAGTQEEDDE